MTRTRLLAFAAVAVTIAAVIASITAARGSARHTTGSVPLDTAKLSALAIRFVTAATESTGQSVRWSDLAAQPLARDLARYPAGPCSGSVHVVDVSVTSSQPPAAYVIAQCRSPRNDGPVAVAWTLRFTDGAAGWRVAAVTS